MQHTQLVCVKSMHIGIVFEQTINGVEIARESGIVQSCPALALGRPVDPIDYVILVNVLGGTSKLQQVLDLSFDEFEDGVMQEGQTLLILHEVNLYLELREHHV